VNPFTTFPRHQYRFIIGMALVVSFRILGLSLLIPVIAVHGQNLTDSTVLIGIALGGYGATQALFQIPYGLASDRFGRKPLIVLGMLIFSLGSFLGGMADTIELLILSRILQGGGAVTATVFAFINDVIDVRRRNFATALIGAPIGIFFSVGVIAGPIIAHVYSIDILFFISGILALFITLYLIFFIQEERPDKHRPSVSRSLVGSVFRDMRLLKIDIAGLLMYSSINAIFYILPLMMADIFGLEMNQFVYIYFPMIMAAIIVMISFARLADKGLTRTTVIISFLLITIGSIGMLVGGSGLFLFAIGAIVAYAGSNALEPILPIFVGKVAQANVVGTAMGAYSTVQFMGSFVGAIAVGFLLPYGFTAAIGFLTFLGVAGVLLAVTMKNPVAR
jgi:MFS family permease